MNLLHHNEHPPLCLILFSDLYYVLMAELADYLDFVPQKFFFSRIQFSLIYLFKCVSHPGYFMLCFKHLTEFTSSKFSCLGIELIHWVELAMVLKPPQPLINNCFFFMEISSFSKVIIVVIKTQAEIPTFVFDLFEIQSS